MRNLDLLHIVAGLIPMILSLSVHEASHALVAFWLGDTTAQRAGRLTLNPLVHIDPLGTLLIPAIAAVSGFPFIGWAKPCPVDPRGFRRNIKARTGMALVAAAGPLSNLLLAVLAAAVIAFGPEAVHSNVGLHLLLTDMFLLNVLLCVFNFIPLPPLDGSRLLPRSLDGMQAKIRPYSMFILMGVLFAVPQLIMVPGNALAGGILRLFHLA